jgi:hypothetical protein
MAGLHADILCHILQTLEATALNLSLLNNLKAVGKQWLRAVRRVLGQHAGGVGMPSCSGTTVCSTWVFYSCRCTAG